MMQSPIQLHSDRSQRVVLNHSDLPWQDSPSAGIQRKLLERDGGEVARATSVVRYAPGSKFSTHTHGLGEEILVLDGALEDEHGQYPAGYYLKSPPGSSHAPGSAEGCILLVKLRHLDLQDTETVRINTSTAPWHQGLVGGLSVMPLSEWGTQHTALVRWAPGTRFSPHRHYGGEEIFVLSGVFEDEFGRYPQGSWLRSPHLSSHQPFSTEGCTIFVKTGHLLPPLATGGTTASMSGYA